MTVTDVKPCGEVRENWLDSSSKYTNETWPFNHLVCSSAFDNKMSGGYFSPKGTQFVKLRVDACLGGPDEGCAPTEDVSEFFESHPLMFIYKDTYVDGANKTNSVQEYTNTDVFVELSK